jgi:hypothetical protein
MSATLPLTEWKGQERRGNHSQGAFPFLAAVRPPTAAPGAFVGACDEVGAIRLAAQQSGMDDFEIADHLHISHGYMSKVLHGTAGMHGKRLVSFMRITGSLAPLQWLAEQMGCDLVQRDSRAAEIAELQSRLNELQRKRA